jgi:dethiobiotin synthetase
VVSAAIAAAHGAVAWKPVASGAAPGTWGEDAELLAAASGTRPEAFAALQAPLSPHRAARMEGRSLVLDEVLAWIRAREGPRTVIEGVGGWRVPVAETWDVADLAVALAWPVLVVAEDRLGAINHARLTVEAVRGSGLPLVGVVLNDLGRALPSNAEDLAPWSPVWTFPRLPDLERDTLGRAGRLLPIAP